MSDCDFMLYLINKYGVSRMNFLKKTLGFLAVCSIVPAAYALTARPSVINTVTTASRRLPTMTAYLTSSGTTTGSTSNLLDNAECIDAYTSCLQGADVCGPNFEECTTDVLFHGQMPKCLSTLAQCSASGINALFGTSNTTALGNVASRNAYDEITDYVYPTDGSVLGQMIAGAAISNMYSTSDCVRRYTTCLQRDNVCGADFELCTTNTEFRKQKVYCDSTLARCQSDGKIELFGSTNTTVNPAADSRVGVMIAEGAALAAVNAVSTCYKVADQCILNACAQNPYKCYEDATVSTINLVDAINSGSAVDAATTEITVDTNSSSAVQSYIRNACLDTIGSNKYCYATFLGNGVMPTASQLSDADNQEDTFAEAYSARMNSSMKARITELIQDFDTDAKSNCANTIQSCAMRVCGGGSGAACYSQVFGATDKTINNSVSYNEIKTGCQDIVNTDPYCKYAAANPNDVGGYTYTYINNNAFDTLFPEYSSSSGDPIGVIAALNASLATSYSDAAIAQMRTQCESVAKSCVRSMCGEDFMNCYRNRTDVYSSLTNTGSSSFDNSMNKVGGVLDYTVVLGLCLDTVKNADVCQEHLAIEQNKLKIVNNSTSSWGAGTNSVRQGWIDAGAATNITENQVQATDDNGNLLCTASDGSQGVCYSVDASGRVYDTPVYMSYSTYVQNQAASTLFRDLIYDLEKEAQAIYNSKLTQEQNMCLAANSGGIMASGDTGGTYMWVKLRGKNVPNDYTIMGLDRNDFAASNELYGSFCSVQVRLQSDDADIQNVMNGADWATTYFAVGDAFTCGSWIPSNVLEELANQHAADETADMRDRQGRTEFWTTLLGTLGGGAGGAFLGNGIQKGTIFGGLTSNKNSNNSANNAVEYLEAIERAMTIDDTTNVTTFMARAESEAKSLNVDSSVISAAKSAVNAWVNAQNTKSAGAAANATQQAKDAANAITNLPTLKSQAQTSVGLLKSECENPSGSNNGDTWWNRSGGALVGGVVTAAAGGFLVNKATRDIQAANLSKAEQEAYDKFMNDVGNHIKCYIGLDAAGQYGDIISVSME